MFKNEFNSLENTLKQMKELLEIIPSGTPTPEQHGAMLNKIDKDLKVLNSYKEDFTLTMVNKDDILGAFDGVTNYGAIERIVEAMSESDMTWLCSRMMDGMMDSYWDSLRWTFNTDFYNKRCHECGHIESLCLCMLSSEDDE
jgi:hypothetical protein